MATAALIHYNGNIAALVRYVGGTHTYGDMDVATILSNLKPILTNETWQDLHRIYTKGCPAQANITDTEANYQAFRKFGNHKGANENVAILRKALTKTSRRNLMIVADDRLADFCTNVHFQPLNVVDVLHRYRKPRCITDCSTRPEPWCFAINDWTSKLNEPRLTFAGAFTEFLVWGYNLAITYPRKRKASARDDIQNVYPRLKKNPNVVGAYSAAFEQFWLLNTGQTFGENTSPSNFDATARARKQVSQAKWHDAYIIEQAAPYLPSIADPHPMTDEELQAMTQATRDSINTGVLDSNGNRLPPTFSHHVDDNMYSDLASMIKRAASASVISAYEVFGYPQDPPVGPDLITWEKWVDNVSHIDEPVGYGVDLHRLILYLPHPKRAKLAETIEPWLHMKHFGLREAAELIGQLVHAAQTNREAKALYFCLQNAFRRLLRTQYFKVRAWYTRMNKRKYIEQSLPPTILARLESLVQKSMATVLWNSSTRTPVTDSIREELRYLHNWLIDESQPWEIPIGHVIPRDITIQCTGDASKKHWEDTAMTSDSGLSCTFPLSSKVC